MDTDAARWIRRAGDAATEAILAGADPESLRVALEAGIAEGHRVRALRQPAQTTPPTTRTVVRPDPGSAVERLLRVTNAA